MDYGRERAKKRTLPTSDSLRTKGVREPGRDPVHTGGQGVLLKGDVLQSAESLSDRAGRPAVL